MNRPSSNRVSVLGGLEGKLDSAHSNVVSVQAAAALKAAGDPMRLDILKIMRRDSFGVLELCTIFEIQQPSMSHHLKVMTKAGLLASRREGNSIFYRRVQNADQDSQKILDQIYLISDISKSQFGNMTDSQTALFDKVETVQQVRKKKSAAFFQENIERFREQQDLIASFSDYGEAVQDLFRLRPEQTWLEVGVGQGDLLALNYARFSKTIALDISKDLLSYSRQRLQGAAIEFFLGDTSEALNAGLKADCISCNMVLHHVPSPATVVADMAAMLNQGGQLLICDLDEHGQQWAQSSCGDLWLGFSADQISQWAADAYLVEGREQFLALRNGFRVQIREFIKE